VLYELKPATHIQKHFNDSIADTSIPFMLTVTVILLMLRFMIMTLLNLMICCDLMILMMIDYADCTVRRLMLQTKFTLILSSDNFDCVLFVLYTCIF